MILTCPLYLIHSIFAQSVWPAVILLSSYLLFVYLGPKWMKNRPAYVLKWPMMAYNILQICANTWAVSEIVKYYQHFPLSCSESVSKDHPYYNDYIYLHFIYFWLKVCDLTDTIFIVLRKKSKQLSFLHVYHHTIVCLVSAVVIQYYPGGPAFYLGLINSIVHVIMYTYYFVSSWYPNINKMVFIKKFITQIQMIQFTILVITFGIPMFNPNCNFSKLFLLFFVFQMGLMLYLFGQFYVQTYLTKKTLPTKKNK